MTQFFPVGLGAVAGPDGLAVAGVDVQRPGKLERLVIARASDWRVLDVLVDGRSVLTPLAETFMGSPPFSEGDMAARDRVLPVVVREHIEIRASRRPRPNAPYQLTACVILGPEESP